MIRFGIVGCGVIHGMHAEAVQKADGATIAGFFDVIPERSAGAAAKYGGAAFESLAAMFDTCDAVTVCVPSGLHAQIGIEAAKAGKHVIVEKPIDITFENASRLVQACRENGVKFTTISQHRFANDIRRVREAVQNGELGDAIQGDAYVKWYRTQAYYDSGDWRGTWALDGGGCLMNQGVHYVDMIQWIMGGVKAVRAITRTAAHKIEVEDLACALIEYKSGAVGVIQGSTSAYPGFSERIEVHGKCGSALIEGDLIKAWHVDPNAPNDTSKYGRGVESQPTPNVATKDASTGTTGASDPSAIWSNQHNMQVAEFVRAVQEDRDPFITGEMALEPLKVILAIYKSAKLNGERVEV